MGKMRAGPPVAEARAARRPHDHRQPSPSGGKCPGKSISIPNVSRSRAGERPGKRRIPRSRGRAPASKSKIFWRERLLAGGGFGSNPPYLQGVVRVSL